MCGLTRRADLIQARGGRPVLRIEGSNTPTSGQNIRHIETFAKFLGRSPYTATGDDIRRFQLAQVEQGAQPPKMNTQASALRFFFTITLGRADLAHQLARTHRTDPGVRC